MSLEKKKKISGKKSKRWRSIDVTDIMDGIQTKHQNERLEAEAKEKIKNQKNLFFIDDGNKAEKSSKRAPLDPDRFKKKKGNIPVAPSEKKVLEKIASKLKKKNEILDVEELNDTNESKNELDVWNEEPKKTKKVAFKQAYVPAVIPPHPGQSYNPAFKAHKELINNVISEEVEILKRKEYIEPVDTKPGKPIVNQHKKKYKTDEEIAHAEEVKRIKIEKKKRNDANNLRNIIKEIDTKLEQQEKRQEERRKKKEEEEKLIAEGKLFKAKKLGRGNYEYQGTDFQKTEDLAQNLRNLNPTGNLLRDRFDSVFRRNIMEPRSNLRRKRSKFPKFKMHNIYRGRRDEDDDDLKVHK